MLFNERFLQFKAQLDQLESFRKSMLNCSFYSRQSLGLFVYYSSCSKTIYSEKLSICRNTLPHGAGITMEKSNMTKQSHFHKISSDILSEIYKVGLMRNILLSKLRGRSHCKGRTDTGMRRTRVIVQERSCSCVFSSLFPISFPIPCPNITSIVQSILIIRNALEKNNFCIK